ncbi:MAG: potassium channel family protein [Halobacteriales archaeon]
MRAVIVGYGRVGIRTARILAEEGHQVTVVDLDPEKVRRAHKAGYVAIHGDASDPEVLAQAQLGEADAVAALTSDVGVNHGVCTAAAEHDLRTVLRVEEDYPDAEFRRYETAADAIVYPAQLGAAGAKIALLGGDSAVIAELAEHLQLLVLTVKADAPVEGVTVGRVQLPAGARLYAHGRGDESMTLPLPSTRLEAGDRLALIVEADAVGATREAVQGTAA